MKRIIILMLSLLLIGSYAYAEEGEAAFFGGVSEGKKLPYEIDKKVAPKTTTSTELKYKEIIFITGRPVTFEGTIKTTKNDKNVRTTSKGTYTETYAIKAADPNNVANVLNRTVKLTTRYTNENGLVKRDSQLDSWTETVTVDGQTYTLNKAQSSFSKSGLEDISRGVSYFDTTVTYRAVYTNSGQTITIDADNKIYGYNQPWSKVETHNMNQSIYSSQGWEMEVELKPFMIAHKTLYFDETLPTNISFDGAYNMRHERESSIRYNITTHHPELTSNQLSSSVSIKPFNDVEKLTVTKGLEFLKGFWGESDIRQLYSLGIMTEIPHKGMQYQLITRGEFIKQLCLAFNLDTSKYTDKKNTKLQVQIFSDVDKNHPMYPYVMTAYDANISDGRGKAFDVDMPIDREEAFALALRAIGLERLGITENARTPFVDDSKISSWSRKEIASGYRLGLITGDNNNYVNPKKKFTKAESAAFINRLIKYLGYDYSNEYQNMY